MKATIDLDDALYRQLKIEAARRGSTVRELVTEGVRYVLEQPEGGKTSVPDNSAATWQPSWLGSLGKYGGVADHSMPAVRKSVETARKRESGKNARRK